MSLVFSLADGGAVGTSSDLLVDMIRLKRVKAAAAFAAFSP